MNETKEHIKQGLAAHDFEKTNAIIGYLFDPKNTIRYREVPRQRIIPKMVTHPIKEAPHF